jgi:hypothetical protein
MLCPFCLKENTIKKIEEGGRSYYICSECPQNVIPITYAENEKIPRDVISAIGFKQHGKSAYFASLFSSLDALASPNVWPDFFTFPANEQAMDVVNNNVRLLKKGELPQTTPKQFPLPTIVQFSNMPKFKKRFLIFYDTGGENFERASSLIDNAKFITRSQTATFFISLHDLEYNPQEMARLLNAYIIGLKDLGGNPKQQHLLVVLTKGDLLASKLELHKQIWDYLVNGDVKNIRYSNINSQMTEMKKISKLLKDFLIEDIGATIFLNLAKENFSNVEICIISALGASPKGRQLDISVTPKRIFDPILWVMNNSTGWFAFFFRLKVSLSNLIKKAQTSTKKESQAPLPPVIRKPINYRSVAKYGAGALILALVILFLYYPGVFPALSLPAFNLAQTPATTIPAIAVNAKNLDTRSYGDYLAAGQTNAYYFDIAENSENIEMIKVFAQAKSGNIITAAVGLNYAPSIENDKYDYLSSTSTTSDYAVIQINNPMPGRYYVIVKGVAGSGDTKVSRSFY